MSEYANIIAGFLDKLNLYDINLVQHQTKANNVTVVQLDECERMEVMFRKEVDNLYQIMKRVQTQKLEEALPTQQNPFEIAAKALNPFKKACMEAAKTDERFENLLYELEKYLKEKSDMQRLNLSGSRLQNYYLPEKMETVGSFIIGFRIQVKKTCRLYTEWDVSKINIIYPEDCYSPYPPDMVKKCIKGIKPSTIEIAILNDKGKLLYNHPLFKDFLLPRFSNLEDLVDCLEQLSVKDDVNLNNNNLTFDFMEQENEYF